MSSHNAGGIQWLTFPKLSPPTQRILLQKCNKTVITGCLAGIPIGQRPDAVEPTDLIYSRGGAKFTKVVEITEWRAESLRTTAFIFRDTRAVSDAAQAWQVVMGRTPDRVASRTREGIQTPEGSIQGDDLVVSSQAGRIDLRQPAHDRLP